MALHIEFTDGSQTLKYTDITKMEATDIMRKLGRRYYLRLERVLSTGYIIIAVNRGQFGN